jgi:phosphomannomutase
MAREHLLKIGVSGIRGVVGEFLTPALACAFAQAFGTYVQAGRVVVGRDTRASGEMLQHAVQCGLLAAGCEVVDVGILPTPTIQVYVGSTHARGGIALTASHNPPEYNDTWPARRRRRGWRSRCSRWPRRGSVSSCAPWRG